MLYFKTPCDYFVALEFGFYVNMAEFDQFVNKKKPAAMKLGGLNVFKVWPRNLSKTRYNTVSEPMLTGVDWIYFYAEQMLAYDFVLLYFWHLLTTITSPNSVLYRIMHFYLYEISLFVEFWTKVIQAIARQLTWNVKGWELFSEVYKIHLGHNFFKSFELTEALETSMKIQTENSNGNYTKLFNCCLTNEGIFSILCHAINLLMLIYVTIIFVAFYFQYSTSFSKEDSTVDNDFMIHSITLEAEEEIASIDDAIFTIVLVMYVFGWFFYIHCWVIFGGTPELTILFYVFPILYYIILKIPTMLILDFGLFFLTFLKGSSQLPLLALELIYDYIALAAFYIRVLVQSVRLILMIFTFFSLHEMILEMKFNQRWLPGHETFIEHIAKTDASNGVFSYYFLTHFLVKITHWLYELFHAFFVLTAQFAAFFAMIFWLFFFLYTSFTWEKQENYFESKRKQKKMTFSFLQMLKKIK